MVTDIHIIFWGVASAAALAGQHEKLLDHGQMHPAHESTLNQKEWTRITF